MTPVCPLPELKSRSPLLVPLAPVAVLTEVDERRAVGQSAMVAADDRESEEETNSMTEASSGLSDSAPVAEVEAGASAEPATPTRRLRPWRQRRARPMTAPAKVARRPLTEAEVAWLVEKEYARSADDVLWRRSKLGLRLTGDQAAALEDWMQGERAARHG